MESREDNSAQGDGETSSVHQLAQTPSEQLAHFDDAHKRDAKPMQRKVASPKETEQAESDD